MATIPRDTSLDSALALIREGNRFIVNRCQKFDSDIFETRLMFKKTICIKGEEAAKEFYEDGRLTRRGAIPKTVLWSLQDEGSVATLDGEAHHQRKRMFMLLMTHSSIQLLANITDQ